MKVKFKQIEIIIISKNIFLIRWWKKKRKEKKRKVYISKMESPYASWKRKIGRWWDRSRKKKREKDVMTFVRMQQFNFNCVVLARTIEEARDDHMKEKKLWIWKKKSKRIWLSNSMDRQREDAWTSWISQEKKIRNKNHGYIWGPWSKLSKEKSYGVREIITS